MVGGLIHYISDIKALKKTEPEFFQNSPAHLLSFSSGPPVQPVPWGQLNKGRDKEGSPNPVTTALISSELPTLDIYTNTPQHYIMQEYILHYYLLKHIV